MAVFLKALGEAKSLLEFQAKRGFGKVGIDALRLVLDERGLDSDFSTAENQKEAIAMALVIDILGQGLSQVEAVAAVVAGAMEDEVRPRIVVPLSSKLGHRFANRMICVHCLACHPIAGVSMAYAMARL